MNPTRSDPADDLLHKARQRAQQKGYLDLDELVALVPDGTTPEQTAELFDAFARAGIPTRHTGPSRRRRTDPQLLTRAQEVALAHRIRSGQRRRLRAVIRSPLTVAAVIQSVRQVKAGNLPLWQMLADYEGSHPDADQREARAHLLAVAARLEHHRRELRKWVDADAHRRRYRFRNQRVASAHAAMVHWLSQLDLRESFIDGLTGKLLEQARRAEKARAGLGALAERWGLPADRTLAAAALSDAELRALVRDAGLRGADRRRVHNQLKNLGRALAHAATKSGLSVDGLLRAGSEIRRGQHEAAAARDRLVEANQRLVMSIARRYPQHSLDFLDLVQEGNLGLLRAADRFDPERGFRFGTYAAWWVRQSIGRLVAEQGSAVRIPPHVQESLHKVTRITRRLVLRTGREPTVEELAEQMGKSPERIKEILAAGRRPVSTDSRVGDNEDSAPLLDFLPDPHAGPDEEADRRVQQAVLQDAMGALTVREQDIIALRFQTGLTLQEVGDRYGITRERTRQLQAQALRKLRKRLKADLLRRLIHDDPLAAPPPQRR
jgi:RNA polymerase primary sigma factor